MTEFDFVETPTLETRRLVLRRITDDDHNDWLSVLRSPGVIDYLVDFESKPDDAIGREIIRWTEDVFKEQTGIRWAITLKPAHTLIGSCGFHLFERRHRRADIGYELHSEFWRQGIMTEAVKAVLGFCFESLGVHRVQADVAEGNAASAALLKKAGFTLEGIWREHFYSGGAYRSLWQFGLLAPEYRALHDAKGGQ